MGNFLTISRSNICKLQIFQKNRFHSNWRSYLVLTPGQKPKKKLLESFLGKKSVSDFGWFGDLFANISKSRIFFKNPALWFFYVYSPLLTSCNKSEKSLEPFLRKLRYQPIITNNTNFLGPGWRRSNKNFAVYVKINWIVILKHTGKFAIMIIILKNIGVLDILYTNQDIKTRTKF